jgi:hypothetical protein
MAATFIKKNDGNYYLRLTDSTTSVKFAAVSQAGNTYTFSVGGTQYVSKPSDDGSNTYYTSSASPIPSGGILDDSRFPGTETAHTFSGSGVRDYLLSFSAGPTPGTRFYLGGEALSWGGYAYPGSGYIANPIAVGVKQSGSWKNAGNIFVKQSGTWREVTNAYIKQGGVWKKYYQNFGNSSWINMLELTDDAIDFGVQVFALN